jgi:uncharacterized membrane protein
VSIRIGRRLQIAAVFALIAAYAGLSHYCNARAGEDGARSLGAALALAPLLIVGSALLWRSAGPLTALLLAVLAAAILHHYWPLLEGNFSKVYLLQECSLWGLLAYGFGRSLRAGSTAVCTELADKVHGPLTPGEMRYARQVTAAWACFFGIITALNLGLYLAAPLRVWSLFVNFATLPLVAVMFAAEYAVRRRVLPQADRSGILATVRVFLASSR